MFADDHSEIPHRNSKTKLSKINVLFNHAVVPRLRDVGEPWYKAKSDPVIFLTSVGSLRARGEQPRLCGTAYLRVTKL